MNASHSPHSGYGKASLTEKAALDFAVSPKAFRLLEHHRSAVLILRARDASFSQIHDFLKEHGVVVSESSITRFCRKHRADLQRQRLLLEQEIDTPTEPQRTPVEVTSTSVINPPTYSQSSARKVRDLRGEV